MALDIVLGNVCQAGGCKSFTITDDTGVAVFNTGTGWGNSSSIQIESVLQSANGVLDLTVSSDNLSNDVVIDVKDRLFTQLSGHASLPLSSRSVTGIATAFDTELEVGDYIFLGDYAFQVDTITNATSMTVTVPSTIGIISAHAYLYNGSITVSNTDLGLSSTASIADGTYALSLYVDDTKFNYTGETSVLLYCQAKCCIIKKVQQIYKYYECNNCDDDYIDETLLAWSLLKSLENAGSCTYSEELDKILSMIQRICSIEDCNC